MLARHDWSSTYTSARKRGNIWLKTSILGTQIFRKLLWKWVNWAGQWSQVNFKSNHPLNLCNTRNSKDINNEAKNMPARHPHHQSQLSDWASIYTSPISMIYSYLVRVKAQRPSLPPYGMLWACGGLKTLSCAMRFDGCKNYSNTLVPVTFQQLKLFFAAKANMSSKVLWCLLFSKVCLSRKSQSSTPRRQATNLPHSNPVPGSQLWTCEALFLRKNVFGNMEPTVDTCQAARNFLRPLIVTILGTNNPK